MLHFVRVKMIEQHYGHLQPSQKADVIAGKRKGVFVTTSYFSKPALEYLKTISTRIVPVDGRRLVELMIEHEVGTRTAHTFRVNKMDEDFFLD